MKNLLTHIARKTFFLFHVILPTPNENTQRYYTLQKEVPNISPRQKNKTHRTESYTIFHKVEGQ